MNFNRRQFIGTCSAGTLAMALGRASRINAGQARPNVLVILVDQMRQPRHSMENWPKNIAGLKDSGVSFKNHFTSASPCSPSRACLLTGTYTTQNQVHTNCDFVEGGIQPSLYPRLPTLGHIFRDAGYRTPYRGKWHLTRTDDRNKKDPLIDYGFEGWKPPDAPVGGIAYNGAVMDPIYARQACGWLKDPDNQKQPWFMVCSLVNPHDICEYPGSYPQRRLRPIETGSLPPNWKDDLSGKPGAQREFQENYNQIMGRMDPNDDEAWRRYLDYYFHCIDDLDENVGDVLKALDESGQRENTIVLFIADHGEMGGSHKLRTKGSFAYEEEINVPLIISWPGHLPEGLETQAFASSVDVMPTLISLAGIPAGNYMAGVDLSPVLSGPDKVEVRDEIIMHQGWEFEGNSRFRMDSGTAYKHPAHVRCLRGREWKYVYYFSYRHDQVEHELYNLKNDPHEMDNLASDQGYRQKMKEMRDRLMKREEDFLTEFDQAGLCVPNENQYQTQLHPRIDLVPW